MRTLRITAGIVVAIVLVVVAVFVATFNVNRYRGPIQSQLEERMVRKVSLGEMRLNVFPLRFGVRNLAIADDPTFPTEKPFVQAQQLDMSVRLLPLLKGNIEIDSLNLQNPVVELIKNQQGMWNFSSLGGPSQPGGASGNPPSPAVPLPSSNPAGRPLSPGAPSEPGTSSTNEFSLVRLTISDGQIAVTDLQAQKPRAVYDHIDASAQNFAPSKAFSFDVAAHLPGPGTQEIRFQGQGGPIMSDQPAATMVHGTLDLNQVEIAGLRKFLDSPALANVDGMISGQTKISSESNILTANGKINVQNARLGGRELGYPIAAEYDVKDDLATNTITLRNTTLKLGTTPVLINGTVDTKPTPAQVNVRLKADNISITEVAKLAASSGAAFSPGATIVGIVSADIQALGTADKPALSGTLSGRDVQISGKEIPQPVFLKAINLALTPSEIHSDPFDVSSGGTTVTAQFMLRQYLSNSPSVDLTVRAPNAAVPELLSMAKAYGVTGLEKISGAGTLGIDLHAAGPVQALKSANKLAFSGMVTGRDIQISGKDLPQPVQIKAVNLTLTPSEIHTDNFNVTTGGTTIAAQVALRQYLSKSPLVDATMRAPNAALPEMLSLAKAYGVKGLDKISGAGTLGIDLHAAGPVQALSSAELTKALNGTINLNFNNVRYSGIDIGYQLASIGGFLKPGEKDQGFTNISQMTGSIAIKNGFAQSNNVLALLDIGNVGMAGTANLVTEALDLHVTAVLSKSFSQQVGGTGIGGYMSTALANNQGELVIPAIVSGTLEHPKFAPDLQKIAQMKLKGLVPNLNNPTGGVAGILGGLLGQKGGTQAQQLPQQDQQQQQNPVQQLLEIFGGKKKQGQQEPSK